MKKIVSLNVLNIYLALSTCLLCCIAPQYGNAQGFVNNGANLVLTNNSTLTINGDYTNLGNGVVNNKTIGGIINLFGNWINNGTSSAFLNDGATIVFKAGVPQSISGSKPTAFYNIKASGGAAATKTFNTAATVSNLVTVESNTVLNANEKLTLLAGASSHASIGPLLNGAIVNSNVIVQSYFSGGNSGYRVFKGVSSPINDEVITGDKTYKQLQSKIIITGAGNTTKGFDKGNSVSPNATTIKTYNESAPLTSSQFTGISSISQPTIPGKGFFLFYRGNRFTGYDSTEKYATGSKIVGPEYSIPESVTVEYNGPVNQGTIDVDLSYTNNNDSDIFIGTNLVGNPYPSVIDWHLVRGSSSGGGADISPSIYVIKPDGSFASYNSETQVDANGGTRFIMPGQAFYVQANKTSQTLTFTELCKDPYPATGTVMRFLSAPSLNKDFLPGENLAAQLPIKNTIKVLRMYLGAATTVEETAIAFINGTDANFNNYEDALYFSGSPLVLCTKSEDDKSLSINALPEPTAATEIKLNVGTSLPGKLSLKFKDLPIFGGTQFFLEDSYLNKVVSISDNSIYEFEIDNNIAASYGSERLKLIFRPKIILSDFLARKVYGGSEIRWSGVSNQHNDLFTIERSLDGKNFTEIGQVAKEDVAKVNYSFVDNAPETGINYYRLKLSENGNKYSYTNIVTLNYSLDGTEPYFQIYPNPVTDLLNVIFKKEVNATVTIYNLSGQKLKSFQAFNVRNASYSLGGLKAGVYLLEVTDEQNKEVVTEKFIKE